MSIIDICGKQINVDTQDITLDQIQDHIKQEKAEYLTKQGILPEEGTIFTLEKQLFKIIYVNNGKKRISAIWYDDKSQPFSGLPELGSSCSIHGKMYNTTFHNESKKRITIEPMN